MEQENSKETNVKLTDKAFCRLVTTSILGIVVCIFCLCSTTWAWFSDMAPSNANEIKTAKECLLEISVSDDSGAAILTDDEGYVELEAEKQYTVKLTLPKDSSSGYCIITAGEREYFSDYIVSHTSDTPEVLEFVLTVTEDQRVKIEPHWGIYSRDGDVQQGILTID